MRVWTREGRRSPFFAIDDASDAHVGSPLASCHRRYEKTYRRLGALRLDGHDGHDGHDALPVVLVDPLRAMRGSSDVVVASERRRGRL